MLHVACAGGFIKSVELLFERNLVSDINFVNTVCPIFKYLCSI